MDVEEEVFTFACDGDRLVGILHRPRQPLRCGVLVVPGAPQYRVGSHRQFVLLARDLAANGFPVMRFDYRGMGDSEGQARSFEQVSDDLRAAIDAFWRRHQGLDEVVLWGFCDGASAVGFYACGDPRVRSIALVNPWVRDRDTTDQALLRHYYLDHLKSADLWRRLLTGKLDIKRSLVDLAKTASRQVVARLKPAPVAPGGPTDGPLNLRLAQALIAFPGRLLLVLSGADLTAQEFEESVMKSPVMRPRLDQRTVTVVRLEGANHNYSKAEWRRQVHDRTIAWLGDKPS